MRAGGQNSECFGGANPQILALRMESSVTGMPRLEPALAARLLRFDGAALVRGVPWPSLSYRSSAICSAVAPSQRQNGRVCKLFWLWGIGLCQGWRVLEMLEERGGGSNPGMAGGAAPERDPAGPRRERLRRGPPAPVSASSKIGGPAGTGLPFSRRWGCSHLRLLSLRTCSV